MKRLSLYILQIALPFLASATMFPAEPVVAESIIRIIGDKMDTPQKKTPEQPVIIKTADKEPKTKTKAEEERLSNETAEQQLAQRLEALKAEEVRKDAEKREQERLAKENPEQENEAARQAAIKQEQELLTARIAEKKAEQERLTKEKREQEKAAEAARQAYIKQEQDRLAARKEESRKSAEKAEQEHIATLKAEEVRLAAAMKAILERPLPETDMPPQKPGSASPVADSPGAPSLCLKTTAPEIAELLLKRCQPVEPAQPERRPLAESRSSNLDNSLNLDIKADNKIGLVPETISDLYLSAKANDPVLARMEARVTGSKAESDLLLSGLLPHIDSSAGVKQISQALTNYTTHDENYDYTALNYNITASMTLLHASTIYSLSAAAAGLRVEQAGVAGARQNLIVKFTDSYFALLKAQTDMQIAQGEINRLKQVLDQSQAFLKAGTGDIIAVYEAQSRLDGASADLTKSESSLRLAEQKLSSIAGKPVTSVVNYLPQQPTGPDPDNLDWWVATMEKEQPAVRQAREEVDQAAEQRKAIKAEYLPILEASGGYDVNRGTAALPTAEVRQWFVGASISLPLYSGGETSAKVRRALASEEERRHLFDETMDQQRENVKQAFYNLSYNISLIKALEQKKTSAEIQLAAVKKGRKIGTRSAIDVLNAEQAYSIALRDYKYAQYDNMLRVIQLKSAAGILTEADVSEVSRATAPTLGSGIR